ncbi:MAG: SIR2 family protein [Nitrospirae bacterium]|nr:SIR2 family protein [Nitrospirota bacterium]
MSKPPDLREMPDLPDEVRQAALDGNLVLFVGAGTSMLVDLPSWQGLARLALEDLRRKGHINYSELEQLKVLDPKKQLSIAELIATENSISLDLAKHLTAGVGDKGIYIHLNKIGCPSVTTNYDELLEPRYYPVKDGSTTATPITRVFQKKEFLAGRLNTPGTVVHLHGSVAKPDTMVVTTKQYLEHYEDDIVKEFLGELFEKKTILFVGYGLEEAEILEHILRKGRVTDTKNKRRFALMPFFRSQMPLYTMLYGYYVKSFGVHLVGFIRDHKDYRQLEDIVKAWSEQIEVRPSALAAELDFMDEVLR